MAGSTARREAWKRRFDSLMAEDGCQTREHPLLQVSTGRSELTCAEFDRLRQGRHVLLHLLISLATAGAAAAAAQDLHHVPVDPVRPGQGVPVHLRRAYLPSKKNQKEMKLTPSESRRPHLNRWRAVVAVPKLSFVSGAHLFVVFQHANAHAALQAVLNVLHVG